MRVERTRLDHNRRVGGGGVRAWSGGLGGGPSRDVSRPAVEGPVPGVPRDGQAGGLGGGGGSETDHGSPAVVAGAASAMGRPGPRNPARTRGAAGLPRIFFVSLCMRV